MSNAWLKLLNKGDQVEVLKPDGSNTFIYHAATLLRSPSIRKTQVFLEYETLIVDSDGPNPKRLREVVDGVKVRPLLPSELNESFKAGDEVDVFCDGGWRKGNVKDILENSKYVVKFDSESEYIVAEQCNLRLHREWDYGSWLPPQLQPKPLSTTEVKSKNLRLKIKFGNKNSDPMFKKGSKVEIRSDEEGYQGSWYAATIVGSGGNDKFFVEYLNLVTDDGAARLTEVVKREDVRPFPPPVHLVVCFKLLERVDAWFNEGWWEGVVWKVLNNSKYMVYFSYTHDILEYKHSNLRPHLVWSNGKWNRGKSIDLWGNGRNLDTKFCKGTNVEVKSDEIGFEGAWFTATIVEEMENENFLVQYDKLLTDDGTNLLREEANASDIRPLPPHIQRSHAYEMLEIVDAWYNDGWWVGSIIRVQKNLKYKVYFKTKEELEFEHCALRPHQEWIDGNWIVLPKEAAETNISKFRDGTIILQHGLLLRECVEEDRKLSHVKHIHRQ